MTYKELRDKLSGLTDEQLGCDVTFHDTIIDEFFAVESLEINEADDVLDAHHPYLKMLECE